METKLAGISQLSRENPKMVFTSIGHLIDKEMLKECHNAMAKDKAVGIDGVDYSIGLIDVVSGEVTHGWDSWICLIITIPWSDRVYTLVYIEPIIVE